MAIEKLRKQEVFELLRPEQIDLLSEAAKVVKFKAGETVYSRGEKADHFYIVLKGQIALRLPGKGGLSVPIDELTAGDMFGGCISSALDGYVLNAQCMDDSEILVLDSAPLKKMMDKDCSMGYIVQSRISAIYFKRYIETMEKLQALVMNIPLEGA